MVAGRPDGRERRPLRYTRASMPEPMNTPPAPAGPGTFYDFELYPMQVTALFTVAFVPSAPMNATT